MTKTALLEKPTLKALAKEVIRLEERVEDLEDLQELERSVRENGKKPLIPWEKAKKHLNLD